MASFIDNFKTVMAPYKAGAMPKYIKSNGEIKSLEDGLSNNEVKASALRDIIRENTGGRVEVTDSVNNENSLLGILRSYMRMKNYGNGNLVPDNVIVADPEPRGLWLGGVVGEYVPEGGTEKSRDFISVKNTSFKDSSKPVIDTSESRWHPVKGDSADETITHELAHGAQAAYDEMPYRYYQRVEEDAKKYAGKFSAKDIIADSLDRVKYAIPKLFDAVFGTHIVPTEEEWGNMTDENAARFWERNFTPLKENFNISTPQQVMLGNAASKLDEIYPDETTSLYDEPEGIFEQAAKNTGFDSVDEANKSISGYAGRNWTEAFAEAYSDVLLNGDKAVPYSKELIRLYSEAADKWAKRFRKDDMPMQIGMLKELMDVSPIKGALSLKKK